MNPSSTHRCRSSTGVDWGSCRSVGGAELRLLFTGARIGTRAAARRVMAWWFSAAVTEKSRLPRWHYQANVRKKLSEREKVHTSKAVPKNISLLEGALRASREKPDLPKKALQVSSGQARRCATSGAARSTPPTCVRLALPSAAEEAEAPTLASAEASPALRGRATTATNSPSGNFG